MVSDKEIERTYAMKRNKQTKKGFSSEPAMKTTVSTLINPSSRRHQDHRQETDQTAGQAE